MRVTGTSRQTRRVGARLGDRSQGWTAMDRVVGWGLTVPRWASAVVIGALLVVIWVVVYAAGGTKTATPHLFYIPILLAVLPFGIRGTSVVAVAAAVVAGPFVPLDTGSGEQQALVGMLIRGSSFLSVGVLASMSMALRQRLDDQRVARDLQDILGGPLAPPVTTDTGLIPLVADILSRRAFHPVFQPIYSLHNGYLVAVESLTRFDVEPYRPPDAWFAAAELAGLGADLEIAAIEAAIDAAADLPADVSLSLNASPATLADPRLHGLLSARGGRSVTLELTEHAVIKDYDLLEVPLAALRRAGVMIAVDDAGAGFASLQHIVHLSPDVIKLDISLTQHVGSSAVRRALGGALVEFVHRTGAMLVVEGIEDDADLMAWTELGADAVQGYLVGRPGPLPAEPASPIITALLDMPSDAISATAGLPSQRS